MRTVLRRIRGAIGMGFVWAFAWSALGFVPRWIFGVETDVPISLLLAQFGFVAGVIFAVVLALTEGRRRFDEMSLPRFAAWGAVGGLLLAGLFALAASLGLGEVLIIAPTFALACAACASGSLAVARRAVRRELPGSRGESPEAELTDHAKWELRGGGE